MDAPASPSQPDEVVEEASVTDESKTTENTKLGEDEDQPQDDTSKLLDKEIIDKSETSQDLELLRLEEELAELEREEQERKSELESDDNVLDLSSDDLWQIKDSRNKKDDAGVIRFAEDISGFREQNEGVRKRGGTRRKGRNR